MTTSYSIDDFLKICYMNACQRNGIPKYSAILIYLPSIAAYSSCLPTGLAVFTFIHDYNLHIGESNRNIQQRTFYTSNQRSDCY